MSKKGKEGRNKQLGGLSNSTTPPKKDKENLKTSTGGKNPRPLSNSTKPDNKNNNTKTDNPINTREESGDYK